jgi:uncharacterized protein DUF5713
MRFSKRIKNPKVAAHDWLAGMYRDGYFPNRQVDKVRTVLLKLCGEIEAQQPQDDSALLRLTHAATERINDLQEDFEEHDSEIETVAREVIAADFKFIADAYGFGYLDVEELIASRDW